MIIRKRKRWEKALAFVFILSCIVVVLRAPGYSRYNLTLHPFTLAAIFLCGWEFIKKKSHVLQICILLICGITVIINSYYFRENYKYWWRHKVSAALDIFPHKTLEIINNLNDLNYDSSILFCSTRHLFYYHTNKKGIDFRDPKMNIFYKQENKEDALDILKNKLKVKYIFLQWNFFDLQRSYEQATYLKNIVDNDCDLISKDILGSLYKIHEHGILQ